MNGFLFWVVWAIVLVLQQATQTFSMRAKASGSWRYVAVTAIASHAVWFGSQIAILSKVAEALKSGNFVSLLPTALFYVVFCSIGNTAATLLALRFERGSMRVGATQ